MNRSDEYSNEFKSDYVPTPATECVHPTGAHNFTTVNDTLSNSIYISSSSSMDSSSDSSVIASTHNSTMNSIHTILQDDECMYNNGASVSNSEHVPLKCKQNMWIQNDISFDATSSTYLQPDYTMAQTHDIQNVQSTSSYNQQPVFSSVHPTTQHTEITQNDNNIQLIDLTTSTPDEDSIIIIDDDSDDEYCPPKSIQEKLLSYVEFQKLKSAPSQLFNKPFPTEKNLFKIGQKLECIDPRDQTQFCVATVGETRGYRVKLHFDGFNDVFDFWVNADSPDLFYSNWCEKNLRKLNPPKYYDQNKIFSWADYLQISCAKPAPVSNFACSKTPMTITHEFCIGTKLEAVDVMSPSSDQKRTMCVATVDDILGDRILIHFDGWPSTYDYWTNVKSTNYLYPVGWCEKNNQPLIAPIFYRRRKYFTWSKYLTETLSIAVPETAFFPKPLREFSIDMTIEIVDLVVPSLIRIAKIIDVNDDEIKVLYDGFDKIYAYWVDNNSPDIHPVGWCLETNHPLEVPPVNLTLWECNINGCNGNYSTNGSQHNHIEICPYELVAWKEKVNKYELLPNRLIHDSAVKSNDNINEVNTVVEETNKKT